MRRRQFLKAASLATAGSAFSFAFGRSALNLLELQGGKPNTYGSVSKALESDFRELLQWLKENGWTEYLSKMLGVDFSLQGERLKAELVKELDKAKLAELRKQPGFQDFAGTNLVKPGFPAFSLMYHALASPRVRSASFKKYPGLKQIDTMENYIYALSVWDDLKAVYNIKSNNELVFAVFAYEYRPAFKTPHHEHADTVYSRTGIGRIGNEPANYDPINRCFLNKPARPEKKKSIAVTPARYGLFIARKVKHSDVALMNTGYFKNDQYNDSKDDEKTFLQPVRKIFADDLLVSEAPLRFSELHRSEKLYKLYLSKGFKTRNNLKPEIKKSKDLVVQDSTRTAGSSFLVISKPEPLIRLARVGTQGLYFHVPPEIEEENRYFTAYSTQTVEDIELLEADGRRSPNPYGAPRNQAMFINITYEYSPEAPGYKRLKRDASFEKRVSRGGYYAPLFEDSICDGNVDADISSFNLQNLKGIEAKCLPAFSVVTAPDFFPQVDPFDLLEFDNEPGTSKESNFYEGGVASLATARIIPNPKVVNTKNDNTRHTYTAVLSGKAGPFQAPSKEVIASFRDPRQSGEYHISSFLPDVSSSVFAPGWDVTYSKDPKHADDIYIGTEGLGSPFIEDMKFCAALNGMWPATSPDTARTFQGSNEPDYRNPTAIPLLDEELGYHKSAPCTDKAKQGSLGWDGEQGPFLQKTNGKWRINFTDLGRANAIQNALEKKMDMSQLRELTSAELISRMACLRLCIQKLPGEGFRPDYFKEEIVGNTYLWLVSAEKANWGVEDVNAHGIPHDLVGNNKDWITKKSNARVKGPGYLFVFVDSAPDGEVKYWADDKRRRLDCRRIYVCQVTENSIAWQEVLNNPERGWRVE
jgi:hypothetical protein